INDSQVRSVANKTSNTSNKLNNNSETYEASKIDIDQKTADNNTGSNNASFQSGSSSNLSVNLKSGSGGSVNNNNDGTASTTKPVRAPAALPTSNSVGKSIQTLR